jgi:hypothetical protein
VRPALRVLAVLIALRGVGNMLKRFGAGSGLVVLGHLLPRDTPLAPLLGVAMIVYAYGLWTEAAWALPLGVAYALFATTNLLLFPVYAGLPPELSPWLYGIYVVGGIVMSWGAVWLLRRVRALH